MNEITNGQERSVTYTVYAGRAGSEQDFADAKEAAAAFHAIDASLRPVVYKVTDGPGIAPGGSGQMIASTSTVTRAGQETEYGKWASEQDKEFLAAYELLAKVKAVEDIAGRDSDVLDVPRHDTTPVGERTPEAAPKTSGQALNDLRSRNINAELLEASPIAEAQSRARADIADYARLGPGEKAEGASVMMGNWQSYDYRQEVARTNAHIAQEIVTRGTSRGPATIEVKVNQGLAATIATETEMRDRMQEPISEAAARQGIEARSLMFSDAYVDAKRPALERLAKEDIKGRFAELSKQNVELLDAKTAANWAALDVASYRAIKDRDNQQSAALNMAAIQSPEYRKAMQKAAPDVLQAMDKAERDLDQSIVRKEDRKAMELEPMMASRTISERSREIREDGRGVMALDEAQAKQLAKDDLAELRKIDNPNFLDDAAVAINEHMKHPAYRAEFDRLDSVAGENVRQMAAQAGERITPDAMPDAQLTIDDVTLERLAAVREHDRQEALKALGVNQPDREVDDKFVRELDTRMGQAHLKEMGWRERTDIQDVMRDLEKLSAQDWHRAAGLWDKHRPGDIDKPIFIDGDDVKEPAKEAEKRASDRQVEKDLEGRADIPDALKKRYLHSGNRFFYRDDENKLAFEDHGRKLATEHNDPHVAASMVDLATAKGWTSISLKGTEEFKREAWLQAKLKGIDVQGFQPRDVDMARLQDLRGERERTADKSLNVISESRAREATKTDEKPKRIDPLGEQHRTLSNKQQGAIESLKNILRARGDSERAIQMAADLAAERFQTNRVYVGKVIEHGADHFEHNQKNDRSYFVKIETPDGEKTVWGVDLQRAISEGAVQKGDEIALAYQGRQQVTVQVKEYDAAGNVVGTTPTLTNRNAWDARRLDALREEVKDRAQDAAKRSGDQPILKVYDREAPRAIKPPEVTREPSRQGERVRG